MHTLRLQLLLLLLPEILKANQQAKVVYTKVTCEWSTPKLDYMTCSSYKSPQNISMIALNYRTNAEIYLNGLHSVTKFQQVGKPSISFETTINPCDFSKMEHQNMLARLIVTILRNQNVSNLPFKCPLKKNTEYYVKNFYIDEKYFPTYLPELTFECRMQFKEYKKNVINFSIGGEIKYV